MPNETSGSFEMTSEIKQNMSPMWMCSEKNHCKNKVIWVCLYIKARLVSWYCFMAICFEFIRQLSYFLRNNPVANSLPVQFIKNLNCWIWGVCSKCLCIFCFREELCNELNVSVCPIGSNCEKIVLNHQKNTWTIPGKIECIVLVAFSTHY